MYICIWIQSIYLYNGHKPIWKCSSQDCISCGANEQLLSVYICNGADGTKLLGNLEEQRPFKKFLIFKRHCTFTYSYGYKHAVLKIIQTRVSPHTLFQAQGLRSSGWSCGPCLHHWVKLHPAGGTSWKRCLREHASASWSAMSLHAERAEQAD